MNVEKIGIFISDSGKKEFVVRVAGCEKRVTVTAAELESRSRFRRKMIEAIDSLVTYPTEEQLSCLLDEAPYFTWDNESKSWQQQPSRAELRRQQPSNADDPQ